MTSRLAALGVLCALNTVAHFVPFERAALAPDDYMYLAHHAAPDFETLVRETAANRHRPVNHAFLIAQAGLVGDSPGSALLLVFASTTVLLAAAYLLCEEVLGGPDRAFVAAAIFCLLPQKAEVYHTAVFANVNLVTAVYVLGLALFVVHARVGRPATLFASVAAYGVAIFWYEVGFFLPLA